MTFSSSRFKQTATSICYSSIWLLLVPILVVNFGISWLLKRPGYSAHKLSRFGICKLSKAKHHVLIHCASVGEVIAIQTLVNHLLSLHPGTKITITTNTYTGADRVNTLFQNKVSHYYLPYDFPIFTWLFIKRQRPSLLLINEMELWPNLCRTAAKLKIPLYLVNGRMSENSTKTYLKLSSLFQPMFACFTHICAQGQRDIDNYQSLGIPTSKLTLTNNIKFELNISEADELQGRFISNQLQLGDRPVFVAGSTHDPEEQILLDAHKILIKQIPSLILIIVPRHPQRFDKVSQLINQKKFNLVRISDEQPISAKTNVILCDKMGVLRSLYGLAHFAFVGGSIAERGGHNALEPAACKTPIIMGPSRFNNPAICKALADVDALTLVETAEQIAHQCHYWLTHKQERINQGIAGSEILNNNKGALEKTLKIIGFDKPT